MNIIKLIIVIAIIYVFLILIENLAEDISRKYFYRQRNRLCENCQTKPSIVERHKAWFCDHVCAESYWAPL